MTRYEALQMLLIDMSEWELICLHNEYCESTNCNDDRIYAYEELDDLCYHMNPTEIIETYSDIAYCEYFMFDGYGNAVVSGAEDVDIDDIVEYCIDEDDDLYNREIRSVLDNEDYTDEEE